MAATIGATILATTGVPLAAQPPVPAPAVRVAGAGPATYVLLSGIVGGVAGFRRLEERLVAQGYQVIIIDPYNLAIDSADVSFAALARAVEAVLAARDVRGARVVAHAHGAGVALRLAANTPARVSALYFLDVGALAANGSNLLSASIRLVPIIARVPGGRDLIRKRYVQGLRENTGQPAWLDSAARAAYVEPVVRNIDKVVALAIRLARTTEPEPLAAVVARISVPVTLLLGGAPHPSGPGAAELDALVPLGSLVATTRLDGVGHFPHEEVPDRVARVVTGARLVASNPDAADRLPR